MDINSASHKWGTFHCTETYKRTLREMDYETLINEKEAVHNTFIRWDISPDEYHAKMEEIQQVLNTCGNSTKKVRENVSYKFDCLSIEMG